MSTLAHRAAAMAAGDQPTEPADADPRHDELAPLADLPAHTGGDPEPVPVFVAWGRVMRDVEGIAKSQTADMGRGGRYQFRGVDRVVNAFGPACRRHGVIVVPHIVQPTHRDARSAGDKAMRESTTVVTWRVYGPAGDWFEGQSEGESLDTSDKGTAKAQSIALRVFLLAAGLVPTDERDPDQVHHERGERPAPKPGDYRDEIADPRTSLARLRQIRGELATHRLASVVVMNEVGDEEALLAMCDRIGQERKAGGGAA